MEVFTKQGRSFFIDDEDYHLIENIGCYVTREGYVKGWDKKKKKCISIHRLIMGVMDCKYPLVDHINGNPSDNRKSNLRLCSYAENNKNRKASGFSQYLGVAVHIGYYKYINTKGELTMHKRKPSFVAQISIDGKMKNLGRFKNEIDAAKAYNEAAIKHHGEFANLNKFKDKNNEL